MTLLACGLRASMLTIIVKRAAEPDAAVLCFPIDGEGKRGVVPHLFQRDA